jgi:hypothetical protein
MAETSATSATGTVDLRTIEREVRRIQEQLAQKNRGTAVQEFRKDTRDVRFDNQATARDFGVLKKNESRLNLFSLLSKGDTVDVFRFKVATTEKTRFAVLNASSQDKDKLRYQILSRSTGRVIADSDPKAGAAKEAFEQLLDGELEMKAGDYILRVSRATSLGKERDKEFSYAVQLTQGFYTKDYDTVERAARAGDDPFGVNVGEATSNLMGSLAQSYNFINSLPAIGTSATRKLLGLIINNQF